MSMAPYNAADRSSVTLAEAQAAVGCRAELVLTGTIVEAGVSAAGTFVKFKLDARWGFAQDTFVMDLDPLDLVDEPREPWQS